MFRVRAVYDYASPHEDDLSFKSGQIISVTEEEGDDWYVGQYTDDAGTAHDGLFPKNFVERFEPAPPPRPIRAPRSKPVEEPPAHEPELPPEPLPLSPVAPAPAEAPAPADAPAPASAPPAEAPPADAPKPSPPAKKAPPPVAAKSNAFRDRIAAFNAPAAAPIQPFKPAGAATTFIKKPFVAPPPSRNAYVPPPVRDTPQAKTYRRDEDPEIAERQAQDHEAAERAGLVAHDAPAASQADDEDQPKPTSLKERIALLQKQQQEQAERAAAAIHKEKPKRPPTKKRTESHDHPAEDSEDTGLERVASGASRDRISMDHARPPRSSHDTKAPDREMLSDANDADQSGAGETEDAEGESTSVDDDDDRTRSRQPPPPPRAAAAPSKEPDVGDEQDVDDEDEDEEDEMDAETRRKLELRERMAKMSGGMGMPGMFGGIPMGGLPPKKKKPTAEKKVDEDEEYASPQQRIPMFAMPGMPSVKSPELENRQLAVEKEDEVPHPITGTHAANEVPDVEDVTPQSIQRTPTGERPPPIPSESEFLIPRKPINALHHQLLHGCQSASSETVSKIYVSCDGLSEYVMTVSVSSTCWHSLQRSASTRLDQMLTIARTASSSPNSISQ